MMEYREVYFRIRSSYRYDSGWPDKGVEHAFRDETRTLFQSAGWELHPAREDSSSSDIVTKGQQDLYLRSRRSLRGCRLSNAREWTAMSGTGNSQTRNTWHSWRPDAMRS